MVSGPWHRLLFGLGRWAVEEVSGSEAVQEQGNKNGVTYDFDNVCIGAANM